MAIPRKPDRAAESLDNFIKGGPAQTTAEPFGDKKGRKVTSLSLMFSDAAWIEKTMAEINAYSERKITRSEIIAAAITTLKEKSVQDIAQLVKNR